MNYLELTDLSNRKFIANINTLDNVSMNYNNTKVVVSWGSNYVEVQESYEDILKAINSRLAGVNRFLTKNKIHYDLFEYYDKQPPQLQNIVNKYMMPILFSYESIEEFYEEVKKVGYTFEYGLDAEPYCLRPIGVAVNEVLGFENA